MPGGDGRGGGGVGTVMLRGEAVQVPWAQRLSSRPAVRTLGPAALASGLVVSAPGWFQCAFRL